MTTTYTTKDNVTQPTKDGDNIEKTKQANLQNVASNTAAPNSRADLKEVSGWLALIAALVLSLSIIGNWKVGWINARGVWPPLLSYLVVLLSRRGTTMKWNGSWINVTVPGPAHVWVAYSVVCVSVFKAISA